MDFNFEEFYEIFKKGGRTSVVKFATKICCNMKKHYYFDKLLDDYEIINND